MPEGLGPRGLLAPGFPSCEARARKVSKAPQGNERWGNGFEEPPCMLEPLLFYARRGSKNPGFVLRPRFPLCHCLVGRCLERDRESFGREVSRIVMSTLKDKRACKIPCFLYINIELIVRTSLQALSVELNNCVVDFLFICISCLDTSTLKSTSTFVYFRIEIQNVRSVFKILCLFLRPRPWQF